TALEQLPDDHASDITCTARYQDAFPHEFASLSMISVCLSIGVSPHRSAHCNMPTTPDTGARGMDGANRRRSICVRASFLRPSDDGAGAPRIQASGSHSQSDSRAHGPCFSDRGQMLASTSGFTIL